MTSGLKEQRIGNCKSVPKKALSIGLGSALTASVVVLVQIAASSAFAGDKLLLRKGTVDPKMVMTNYAGSLSQRSGTADFIVQFKKAATEADKAQIKANGFEVFKYLPDDAFIISGSAANVKNLETLPTVNAVIPFFANYKVSPDFSAFSVFTQNNTERVLVKTLKAGWNEKVAAQITQLSPFAKVEFAEGTSILAQVPQSIVNKIAALQGIEHVQPFVEMETFKDIIYPLETTTTEPPATAPGDYSDLKGNEDGTLIMNCTAGYSQGLNGQGQIVAMADTGLDMGKIDTVASDFKGAIKSGFAHGMFAEDWSDPMGHGTHVAGSILGRGTAAGGKIHGCAPGAMLVAQGMWSPVMENLTVPPRLETLFAEANTEGARLHSNSWGSGKNLGAYDGFAVQVDEYTWAHPEFLPIFAAGNSGVDANKDGIIDDNSVSSPGTSKNALTVGASENVTTTGGIQVPIKNLRAAAQNWPAEPIQSDLISNNANGVAMFSSRGPTLDGRIKPDVVAPGTNILSNKSHVDGASPLWGAYNTDYAWSGGTSMATPLTAGAAALARQFLVQKGLNPSGALVKAFLVHTADDMFPGQFGLVGAAHGQEMMTTRPNNQEGYGRVDVSNVVSSNAQFIDEKAGVAQGEAHSENVSLSAKGKLWATLVYTDAPGTSNAAKTLVNDLDLEIVKPNGEVITKGDHTNNIEMVEIADADAGTYTVRVTGTKIPQGKDGKQPFALIISTK